MRTQGTDQGAFFLYQVIIPVGLLSAAFDNDGLKTVDIHRHLQSD